MTIRRVTRYVRALLRGRRPPRFRLTDGEAEAVRGAILLRSADRAAGEPRPEFVAGLHRRLAAEMAGPEREPAGPASSEPARPGVPRRRAVLAGASVAAATAVGSAAAGVVVDRLVAGGAPAAAPPVPSGAGTLSPRHGGWRAVLTAAALPDGAVRAFDAGTVGGFVLRRDGRLRALSGACTHQGCRLFLGASGRELDCPCHDTAFSLRGTVVRHQLPVAPHPLPAIPVRERDGAIEVWLPV